MALTKGGGTVVTDWTAIAQNTNVESGEFDVSSSYKHSFIIQAALDTVTAHTGTKFIIMVTAQDSGNEDWGIYEDGFDYIDVELVGTALTENLTDNPLAAASTTLAMADTAGFETYDAAGGTGEVDITKIPGWRFIEDSTLINSELIYQLSYVTDTSITFADGTANAHVQNTPLYNIAISKTVPLPDEASRAKVIVMNTYDSDGSTLNYRILGGTVTGV